MTWGKDGQKAIIFKEIERDLFNINCSKVKKVSILQIFASYS